jgi:murein DD-endopeptidase MepM/ murein hydrolase activator NlpD
LLPERIEASPLGAIDAQLGRVEQQIASVASAAAEQSIALMRLPTRLPIAGAELTSSFGNRVDPFQHTHAFHAGLDFAARAGTPIVSAAGGIVAFAGFKRDFGWVVEIDHGNGLATRYAHASALLVSAGQVVVPGDRIAMVGSTGRSTGPHLHFEVLRAGDHVDPKRYLAGL